VEILKKCSKTGAKPLTSRHLPEGNLGYMKAPGP
jgi:hypothetical protein